MEKYGWEEEGDEEGADPGRLGRKK